MPYSQQEKDEIKNIVREGVNEALIRVGFTPEKPHETQADLLYIRKLRKGSEETSRVIKRTTIGVALSTAGYLLYEGIRAFIKHH